MYSGCMNVSKPLPTPPTLQLHLEGCDPHKATGISLLHCIAVMILLVIAYMMGMQDCKYDCQQEVKQQWRAGYDQGLFEGMQLLREKGIQKTSYRRM